MEKETETNYGLVMLKPNALNLFLDIPIVEELRGNKSKIFQGLSFLDQIDKTRVVGVFYRDLSLLSYSTELLDVLYGYLSDKRYFPLIQRLYKGKVAFILFEFHDEYNQLQNFLISLKGAQETTTEFGETATVASGIRGLFSESYRFYSGSERNSLPDVEYFSLKRKQLENFLHTCDSPREVAKALNIILNNYELNIIENLGSHIKSFIERHL